MSDVETKSLGAGDVVDDVAEPKGERVISKYGGSCCRKEELCSSRN